jgi:multiple sugar transport system substrate-binding protein
MAARRCVGHNRRVPRCSRLRQTTKRMIVRSTAALIALAACACSIACSPPSSPTLTMSGSAVGLEAQLLRSQLDRLRAQEPQSAVAVRVTPDAADARHQLYVQWLNARAPEPDILQLYVIWTAEFAAAGWIAPLDSYGPRTAAYFPAAIDAQRWNGSLYALPWFMDVGLLYWRTDLMPRPPRSLDELTQIARGAQAAGKVPFGIVWQGARYEGLVTVFVEYLGAFGGRILDDDGSVVVDSPAGVRALSFMRDCIRGGGAPGAVLGWQEEQTRFAFQNGQAAFMRNWPYARPLLADPSSSAVAGRFAVAGMPGTDSGHPTAALGGSVLAINAFSRRKDAAWRALQFLLAPEQMIERARVVGEYPPRRDLYDSRELAEALHADTSTLRDILDRAVARPATPVYSELSDILQVSLHRALTGQQEPAVALAEAARDMRAVLQRVRLDRAS